MSLSITLLYHSPMSYIHEKTTHTLFFGLYPLDCFSLLVVHQHCTVTLGSHRMLHLNQPFQYVKETN